VECEPSEFALLEKEWTPIEVTVVLKTLQQIWPFFEKWGGGARIRPEGESLGYLLASYNYTFFFTLLLSFTYYFTP
jgi:hypothetical protein